jgi:hypothetical protein
MTKSGHTEKQLATIAGELQSGDWLRVRQRPLAKLAAGLRLELRDRQKSSAKSFVDAVVLAVAYGEAFDSAFSEERRIQDLEEMLAAAQQFLETCQRTSVLFHSNQLKYGLTSKASTDKRNAQVSDTENLRYARKEAFAAVRLYKLGLEAALETVSRRRRGQKRTADENRLFCKIARIYSAVFQEKPRSTPGGTFSNVVTHIRVYQTGKALKDVKSVERIVTAALKTIRR